TQKTAACWGGSRYRPMISAALTPKTGSFLAMDRSRPGGCKRGCAHIRCTLDLPKPVSAASLRTDPCVLSSWPHLAADLSLYSGSCVAGSAAFVPWRQPVNARLFKALLPPRNRPRRRVQTLLECLVGQAIGQRQNQARAEYVTGRQRPRMRPTRQLLPLL